MFDFIEAYNKHENNWYQLYFRHIKPAYFTLWGWIWLGVVLAYLSGIHLILHGFADNFVIHFNFKIVMPWAILGFLILKWLDHSMTQFGFRSSDWPHEAHCVVKNNMREMLKMIGLYSGEKITLLIQRFSKILEVEESFYLNSKFLVTTFVSMDMMANQLLYAEWGQKHYDLLGFLSKFSAPSIIAGALLIMTIELIKFSTRKVRLEVLVSMLEEIKLELK